MVTKRVKSHKFTFTFRTKIRTRLFVIIKKIVFQDAEKRLSKFV